MADDRPDTPPHAFDEAYQEPPPERHTRDLNVPLIVTIGLVSCILLIVIGIGTVAWFRYELRQEQWTKVIERENPELRELNLEAEARLRQIDAAMGEVARRYRDATPEQRQATRSPEPEEQPEATDTETETESEPAPPPAADDDDAPEETDNADNADDANGAAGENGSHDEAAPGS